MRDDALKNIQTTHAFIASIGHGLSLVWWNLKRPPVTGDTQSLTAEGRVAVTPRMLASMRATRSAKAESSCSDMEWE